MPPQIPAQIAQRVWIDRPGLDSHRWESAHAWDVRLTDETYLDSVTTLDVRRSLYGAFVTRACDQAKITHGWTIAYIAKLANVGVATIYRWRNGTWRTAPDPDAVERFCDALGIPTRVAFAILWPGKSGDAVATEPLVPPHPDLEILQRRLNDPSTSEQEKFHIRETLRTLALRR